MKKRKLGTSELFISEISLGGMSLSTDKEQAATIVDMALDAGINYMDTADLYDLGANEEIIGAALGKRRQEIILATKVGNRWTEGVEGWQWDASPSYIKQAIHASLKRLGTDYIDVYQLHGGTIEDDWDGIIDTFEGLKKEGLIREYGISSIRPNVLQRFLPASSAKSVMMQYSALDRRPEEWLELIANEGASVVTRGTVAKGLLTNSWQQRLQRVNGFNNYSSEELTTTLTNLASQYNDLHALALAFNLKESAIASTVIGASSQEQLAQTLSAYENMAAITNFEAANTLTKNEQYVEHR
ncbi:MULTISPECIES: aldo/keto reductase [Lysinibacillus]|uniref:aldo/keto reductase n=1 Tax=Lysinibacillus TaxID=400634 RepID=UPI000889AD12|nr:MULTISPECIES: aldo/keto reductase [Lysinibacillus]MCG7437097.1 aldo/keto reductase [Lysinibacillus fusiformis]MED4668812.1 aldo/keto reductase [Lysinibacillus fusiformis]NOG27379.1 aldo/keto reductase [Lysinibacillus fusiformis]PCD83891.1 aldo/keto reductase [Lysinibacillus fusiformis]QAS54939.1 aldo/keto reductase [Lysinibacillus sphaericus]